ncbi:MAG: hypothetical protein JKY94_13070 [Rhodobacteraceae bacterium]|nr:hypothetical protein [Paracoccaceae bacterium]
MLWPDIDLATMALELGATFVAHSISGDKVLIGRLQRSTFVHRPLDCLM